MYPDKTNLHVIDRSLINYIDRIGYTCTLVLQAKTGRSQKSIQDALYKLYLLGFVYRPVKGFVVSRKWANKNPEKLKAIEINLNCKIPTIKEPVNHD